MRNLQITSAITNHETAAVELYFNDIAKIDMVSPQEEVELAQKIKLGDHAALDKLVGANLRFVVSVAKKYQHQGLPLSDLINEGNLGLIKAAKKFDETRGFKFISFAVWWIRQSILAALRENTRMLHLPDNQINLITKMGRANFELEGRLERTPSYEELAELIKVPVKKIIDAYIHSPMTVSYDRPVSDEDDFTLLEKLSDDDGGIMQQLDNESLNQLTSELLEQLSPRECRIIELSFGFNGGRALPPPEISEIIGLTSERVRQIKLEALNKLRQKAVTHKELLLNLA